MTQYAGSNKARQEQIRRRQQFYGNLNKQAQRNYKKKPYYESSSFAGFDYHIWRVRRVAPFALILHAFTLLCFIGWLVFSIQPKIGNTTIYPVSGQVGSFEATQGGAIYAFTARQTFPKYDAPLYSELELEIIDAEYGHVYSVYKDLWQERHPNGEGGRSIYRDLTMSFEVELPKSGTYYIRAIPYNNNEGKVDVSIRKRMSGNIYFKYYAISSGIISFILLLGGGAWGSPSEMLQEFQKKKLYKKNVVFERTAAIAIVLFVGILIINITHHGYAKGGENNTHLPTIFYAKDGVNYLG